MSVLLRKELKHNNQALELVVKYNVSANEVEEVKSIWLITHGKQLPVGNLMMQFFEPAINKIIDETDWRDIYRQMGERDDVEAMNNVFATLNSYFEPSKYVP